MITDKIIPLPKEQWACRLWRKVLWTGGVWRFTGGGKRGIYKAVSCTDEEEISGEVGLDWAQ